jgi:hypothetical protein
MRSWRVGVCCTVSRPVKPGRMLMIQKRKKRCIYKREKEKRYIGSFGDESDEKGNLCLSV